MFEESLVESTHRIQGQSRWTVALSVAIQASIAAVVVIVPLMHPEIVRNIAFAPPQLIAPAPIPPPPPPVQVRVQTNSASSAPAMAAPMQLIKATGHSIADLVMLAQPGVEAPPGVTPTGATGMGHGTSGTDLLSTAPTGPSIAVAAPSRPVAISSGVSAGMLMAPIHPAYPHIAVVSRTQGTVIIHAIISKTGTIESASVVSGPVMLQTAALEAVRSAHYRPYKLNGEPTEVDTTININFHLNE